MSDNTKPGTDASSNADGTPAPGDSTSAPGAAADNHAPEPADTSASAGGEVSADQLKAIIAALQSDLEKARADQMRLLADLDNLRKRTEREKADIAKYAVTKFAQDIVGVVDNFERAAGAVPAGAAEKDPVLKSFLDGVMLAERDFLAMLERHGVKRIDADKQPFNPHQHQAVMEREDTSVPHGTVLQVFQAGFMIEDRCLRPAMVVVSSGGPKGATKATPEGQAAAAPSPGPGTDETGGG